jgi:uncharacterized protein involved in exopolysaccharide biosynthesis
VDQNADDSREYILDQRIARDTELDRDIGLGALIHVVRRYWPVVAGVTVLCTAVAVVYALTATPRFKADVVIAEVVENGAGGAGALLGKLSGFASVAGLNIGSQSNNQNSKSILKSRRLVEEFIQRNDLVQVLFRGSNVKPTLWAAVERFKEGVLTIRTDPRTEEITVSVEWTDPDTAARWANGFVALANEFVRARALAEASRNVDYLKGQIQKTNVIELQRVMYDLIESETKTLMLANARQEYAFTIIDPARSPEIRSSPKRTLLAIGGLGGGLFLGCIVAFVLDARPRSPLSRRSV